MNGSRIKALVFLSVMCLYTQLCYVYSILSLCVYVGPYLKVTEDGTFTCVVCGNKLFTTDEKFDSGSGWPSFSDVASKSDSVVRVVDDSHGMVGSGRLSRGAP